ncbi:hypothetical protein PRZ48_013880 [Zasmidium cellare]|uniref:Enoyl reductase (ER) domain-containing protein n=1 Tax=Zasmidium cellare TaxID=395010 RepID=A0ABR0E2U1_ZASCE|nr:hypothetical protein PRZ48_013880 [Zasmidium cellare]
MPSNTAAWIKAPKERFQVEEAPYTSPGAKEIIVKTAAVAINPLEYKIQDYNPPVGGNEIKYPTILGSDLAGTVVELGSAVSKWKVGDRVMAHTFGAVIGKPAQAAFQEHVVLADWLPTPVPDDIALDKAVVLPLACDTATAGLFLQLGLDVSGLGNGRSAGEVLLLWGGSSSVGCVAIQMARAAGYEVFATASPRNHEFCRSLGATQVYDYGKSDVEAEILTALKGKKVVGALDCIADNEKTVPALGRILTEVEGKKKIVAVLQPGEIDGVEVQRVSIPDLFRSEHYDQVHAWLASALKDGVLRCKPDPIIIGKGLESIQEGIDTLRKGVSAAKVVVKLE